MQIERREGIEKRERERERERKRERDREREREREKERVCSPVAFCFKAVCTGNHSKLNLNINIVDFDDSIIYKVIAGIYLPQSITVTDPFHSQECKNDNSANENEWLGYC